MVPMPESRVTPVPLIIRQERNGYMVEDPKTADFYEMPKVCVAALELMQAGGTLAEIGERLAAQFPEEDIDMPGFVRQLLELNLVEEIDGVRLRREQAAGHSDRPGNFSWLPEAVARIFLHPAVRLLAWGALLSNAALLLIRPELIPHFRDVFLFESMALNSVSWMGLSFVLLMLHELGHLLAVRSFGLPARLGIGRRFLFVVIETEMVGVWRLEPKQRSRAYLAGMGVDQLLLLCALLAQLALPDQVLAVMLAKLAALDLMIKLAFQCCFYLKTDLYYVLENRSGCYNLMERSRAWLGAQLFRNRLNGLEAEREPVVVKMYAVFYVAGYGCLLALIVFYFAPQFAAALSVTISRLADPGSGAPFWDALVFAGQLVVTAGLLTYAWRRQRSASA